MLKQLTIYELRRFLLSFLMATALSNSKLLIFLMKGVFLKIFLDLFYVFSYRISIHIQIYGPFKKKKKQ